MSSNSYELFQTNLYYTKLKNIDHKRIIKYLKNIQNENHKIEASNVGGYHSPAFYHPFPSCVEKLNSEINKFLKKHVRKDFECRGDIYIHNSWFIINKKGDFNKPHKHPPYTFTGVYYIDVPENSGDIVFVNQAEMNNYAMSYTNYNKFNSKDYRLKPETGTLLIFPAWLEHYVTPNLSNKLRIIYSFNV